MKVLLSFALLNLVSSFTFASECPSIQGHFRCVPEGVERPYNLKVSMTKDDLGVHTYRFVSPGIPSLFKKMKLVTDGKQRKKRLALLFFVKETTICQDRTIITTLERDGTTSKTVYTPLAKGFRIDGRSSNPKHEGRIAGQRCTKLR
jgi:hypothetical protein